MRSKAKLLLVSVSRSSDALEIRQSRFLKACLET